MRRAATTGGLLNAELMDVLFAGCQVVRTQLVGRLVDAVFRVNADEHRRRVRCALGAVRHPRLLRRLAALPQGVLVEDPVLHSETSMLPDGIVERSEPDGVGRLLAPPVTLEAVVVPSPGPAQTRHVRVAEEFAPFVTPWVVSGDPRVDVGVYVAASVSGVGLVTRRPEPEVVLPAGPATGRGALERAWPLAEQVYDRWLATQAPLVIFDPDEPDGVALLPTS
ncbi:MAG: hypothetical protein IRZ08_05275 [Frankia sp.]|nr:hypothetical protein [Frankia sp.]